jgi:hypothetical protein
MPAKRAYTSVAVKIGDGGRLLPDLPVGTIGPANFDEKINFVGEIGEVRNRAGWDFPAPTDDWAGVLMESFGVPVEALRGVRRPNGTYAIVGCGSGLIKAYHYDEGWVTIGSGYGELGDDGFRFWQIEDIAGYAVFNNGLDLPCWWQIGDAAVTPLYEFREAGYASAGGIVEYVDGVLMLHDILEIDDDSQSLVMNSSTRYGRITGPVTNLLFYTQDFTNALWTKYQVTPTNGYAAPDGTMTADRVLEVAATGDHFVQQQFSSPIVQADTPYTFSIYVGKSTTRTQVALRMMSASSQVFAQFDLGTVSVTSVAGGGLTNRSAAIESVGTFGGVEWFRLSVTGTTTSGNRDPIRVSVEYMLAGSVTYLGVITQGYDLWGASFVGGTSPGPYVPNGAARNTLNTTRITFRRVWSNIGDPRDFAVSVPGSMDAYVGPTELTLAWPMASLAAGDVVVVIGAGTAGGNLQTTIVSITGTSVILTDPALTTVVDADVARPTDISSIAGWDDIEDDGSAIVCQITLKTQLMTFKASGNIWQTYYTGDVDTPFAKDRVTKKPGVAPIFPRAVVNVTNDNNEEYLLFPGAKHFYRLDLGSQAPQQDPMFMGAEKDLFFSRVRGLGPYEVWAVDCTPTDEIMFAYLWQDYETGYYGANRAIAMKYAKGAESISEISAFNFTCAATIQKPLVGFTCDEVESWFIMGDGDGNVTLYGETNLEVTTRRRYGETVECSLAGGLFSVLAASDNGAYARRFSLDPSSPEASAATSVTIYGARSPNDTPVALETKTLTDPRFPGCMGLYYRKPFFKYRLVSETDQDLRISGFIWRMGGADTQNIDRLQ